MNDDILTLTRENPIRFIGAPAALAPEDLFDGINEASNSAVGGVHYQLSYDADRRHLRVLQIDAGVSFAYHYVVIDNSKAAPPNIQLAPVVAFAGGPQGGTIAMSRDDARFRLETVRNDLRALAAQIRTGP